MRCVIDNNYPFLKNATKRLLHELRDAIYKSFKEKRLFIV